MSKLKKNMFVRWTSMDDEGLFSYRGKITKLSPTKIEITTMTDGVITLDVDDGTFHKIAKPKNWEAPKGVKRPAKKKTVTRAKRTGVSKKDTAIQMYADVMADIGQAPTRQEMISKFVKELGMSIAGASTYAAMAKKANT